MMKNLLAATFLVVLVTTLALPLMAEPGLAQPTEAITKKDDEWRTIKTEVITVLFPADGKKPMFLWWYTKKPELVYVVKYKGLIEYFTFTEPFYKSRHQALEKSLHELFIKPKEMEYKRHGKGAELKSLHRLVVDIFKNWHPPYLPFSACKWALTEVKNITDPKAPTKVIGLAFAFKLVKAHRHGFEFVENNIMIRCRFYYVPVNETADELYKYSVAADEMKMDFVVNNWKWNIDYLKPLLSELKEHKIAIPEGRSGLALWINLASINATEIESAKREPERIEGMSMTSHIMVEGERVFVKPNNTAAKDERPMAIEKKTHEHYKLQFATEDKTLAGFFKFVASAKVTNSTGAYLVQVKASYIEAGGHMRLFIGYPYFNGGALEHDPSIGVDVAETTKPEATKPQYDVEAPSGTQTMPEVLGWITPSLITLELVMALVIIVSMIATVIFAARWKGKTVNVVRVG